MSKNTLVKLLKKQNILKYGRFKLRSGLYSSYYCDVKEALGNQETLNKIMEGIIPIIPKMTTCIACSGYGGIALASVVAYKMKLPIAFVRNEIKDHGTKKLIDGYIPTRNDYVCIMDDVFTTGSSINDTKQKLLFLKCKFVKPVVVLNRAEKNKVISVIRESDLLK
jgi:orotate phosphoribosyltransferase